MPVEPLEELNSLKKTIIGVGVFLWISFTALIYVVIGGFGYAHHPANEHIIFSNTGQCHTFLDTLNCVDASFNVDFYSISLTAMVFITCACGLVFMTAVWTCTYCCCCCSSSVIIINNNKNRTTDSGHIELRDSQL